MTSAVRHIVVPTDFSTLSTEAIDLARSLALGSAATVHLVHVLEEPFVRPGPYQFHLPDTPALRDEIYTRARVRLAAIAKDLEVEGVHATTEVRGGVALDEILKAAVDYGADLIVMGTHARTGLQHLLNGSVAEHVMREARCPVVITRGPLQTAA